MSLTFTMLFNGATKLELNEGLIYDKGRSGPAFLEK